MNKEQQRDSIHEAAEKLAEVIEQVTGKNTRVGVFYAYLDDEDGFWLSGSAGNMNWLERCGAIDHLKDLLKKGEEAGL